MIRLVGERTNRAGVGARIRVDITEDGVSRSIYRHPGSVASFGAGPRRQLIGVGGATTIDRIEVYWPASDTTDRITGLAVDTAYELREGSGRMRKFAYPSVPFRRR